jgi:predicted nucleic acid-binding protein
LEVRLFTDTNWLVAAYFGEEDAGRSAIVQRFSAKFDLRWTISVVVLAEAANVFAMTAGEANSREWTNLQSDLGRKLELSEDRWEAIAEKANELFGNYSHRARLGTLDLFILASALKAGATHFFSFDTNSSVRALAATLKFKVIPELMEHDKRRMAVFR